MDRCMWGPKGKRLTRGSPRREPKNAGDKGSGIGKVQKGQSKETAFEDYFEIQRQADMVFGGSYLKSQAR